MLGGFSLLLLFLLVGEMVSTIGLVLPGNVIGMLLLTGTLALGIVRVEQVRAASNVLLDNLAFFFVPPAVGVMLYFEVIAEHWAAIAIALVIGTLAVLLAVGASAQLALRRLEARSREGSGPGGSGPRNGSEDESGERSGGSSGGPA